MSHHPRTVTVSLPLPETPLVRSVTRAQRAFGALFAVCVSHRIGLDEVQALQRRLDSIERMVNREAALEHERGISLERTIRG